MAKNRATWYSSLAGVSGPDNVPLLPGQPTCREDSLISDIAGGVCFKNPTGEDLRRTVSEKLK